MLRNSVIVVLLFFPLLTQADNHGLLVKGFEVKYSPFTVIAQPGEKVEIGRLPGARTDPKIRDFDGVSYDSESDKNGVIIAPQAPGHYLLQVVPDGGEVMTVNLFVTVPLAEVENEQLNGYRIGPPPPGDKKRTEFYKQPAGFIEVTEDMLDIPLTPHFNLRQFLCKQEGGYPKYAVIQESLLVLLEGLLEAVQQAGYPAGSFGVISGYRTPWYNRKIGNVANSRHVYGDAMDIYLDLDGDGLMDDLDSDGDRDRDDVNILFNIVTRFMRQPENSALIGGVGNYGRTSRHGGFVHVDTRGYSARW
ncbi:MAG: D-Ala-D-Ala carboxypeptidase family metallohydrolase [Halioglobus sp.]